MSTLGKSYLVFGVSFLTWLTIVYVAIMATINVVDKTIQEADVETESTTNIVETIVEIEDDDIKELSLDYDRSSETTLDVVRAFYSRQNFRKELPTQEETVEETIPPTPTPIPTPVPTQAPQLTSTQLLIYSLSPTELDMLARIARAECGGESVESMACIICMVLNRVKSPSFPNTVYEVLYSPNQFTPVRTGTFNQPASDKAWQAIELVKQGYDPSCGATYFSSGKSQWHWNSLQFVGTFGKIYMFK